MNNKIKNRSVINTVVFVFSIAFLVSACAQRGARENLKYWMQPVPEQAKFIDEDYFIWGASLIESDDGQYHLFYSRWKREYEHNAWVTHSEIARAVSDSPVGPFKHVDVPFPERGKEFWDGLCTHNPTVKKFNNKYYLYYMGNTGSSRAIHGVKKGSLNWEHRNNQRIGVAVADSPSGPWKRFDTPLIDVGKHKSEKDSLMVSNPTITTKKGGGFLLIYKAVGKQGEMPFGSKVVHLAATSDSPVGPFKKHNKALFTHEGIRFPAEDPFIWREGNRYRAIVKDFHGSFTGKGRSLALFESSNGFDWKPSEQSFLSGLEINWQEHGLEKVEHLERPQLWFKDSKPTVLFCAADKSRDHSFNVHIPLKAPSK